MKTEREVTIYQDMNFRDAIKEYIREIGYGNQEAGKDVSSYWMDGALKMQKP